MDTNLSIKPLFYYYSNVDWSQHIGYGTVPDERNIANLTVEQREVAAKLQRELVPQTQPGSIPVLKFL